MKNVHLLSFIFYKKEIICTVFTSRLQQLAPKLVKLQVTNERNEQTALASGYITNFCSMIELLHKLENSSC